jgi:hypothetical protein
MIFEIFEPIEGKLKEILDTPATNELLLTFEYWFTIIFHRFEMRLLSAVESRLLIPYFDRSPSDVESI